MFVITRLFWDKTKDCLIFLLSSNPNTEVLIIFAEF